MIDVEVVVPTKNDLEKAKLAVFSVAQQNIKVKKCIVVDDGSSKKVTKMDFSQISDLPIQIVRTEGVGLAAARNLGLRETNSEYIAFLDADDQWLPNKLSNQIEELMLNPDAIGACSGYMLINPDGKVSKTVLPKRTVLNLKRVLSGRVTITGSASSVLVRRSVIVGLGGFNENLDYAEDMDMWLRICKLGSLLPIRQADVLIGNNPGSMQRKMSELERAMKEMHTKFKILEPFAKDGYNVKNQIIESWIKLLFVDIGSFPTIRNFTRNNRASAVIKSIYGNPLITGYLIVKTLSKYSIIGVKLRILETTKRAIGRKNS